jgi:serine/threonine protein kinase
MEYCSGKTLKYLIEKGLYNDQNKVWCLLREILQGLHHIHDQGMIHRDLKPGILISKNIFKLLNLTIYLLRKRINR